jgi:hypothetical protein
MNKLYEQYVTLVRRGMREHPNFIPGVWSERDGFCHCNGHPIMATDARDLITMHAWRWVHDELRIFGGSAKLDWLIAVTAHLEIRVTK